MIVMVLTAGVGAALGLMIGRGSVASVVFAALGLGLALLAAFSPSLTRGIVAEVLANPGISAGDPAYGVRLMAGIFGAMIGLAVMGLTLVATLAAESRRPQHRGEPPVTVSDARRAEIEAEERYRAKLRAQIDAERRDQA